MKLSFDDVTTARIGLTKYRREAISNWLYEYHNCGFVSDFWSERIQRINDSDRALIKSLTFESLLERSKYL